jgi:hypothetical protein
MDAYVARSRELAAGLAGLDGVRVHPQPPHTNAFRVLVDLDHEALAEASLATMELTSTAVFGWWRGAEVPGWSVTELTVGDATLAWEVDEQVAAVDAVLRLAREHVPAE